MVEGKEGTPPLLSHRRMMSTPRVRRKRRRRVDDNKNKNNSNSNNTPETEQQQQHHQLQQEQEPEEPDDAGPLLLLMTPKRRGLQMFSPLRKKNSRTPKFVGAVLRLPDQQTVVSDLTQRSSDDDEEDDFEDEAAQDTPGQVTDAPPPLSLLKGHWFGRNNSGSVPELYATDESSRPQFHHGSQEQERPGPARYLFAADDDDDDDQTTAVWNDSRVMIQQRQQQQQQQQQHRLSLSSQEEEEEEASNLKTSSWVDAARSWLVGFLYMYLTWHPIKSVGDLFCTVVQWIGAVVLCYLAQVPLIHSVRYDPPWTKVVWSRKTTLLLLYIICWDHSVHHASRAMHRVLLLAVPSTISQTKPPSMFSKNSTEISARPALKSATQNCRYEPESNTTISSTIIIRRNSNKQLELCKGMNQQDMTEAIESIPKQESDPSQEHYSLLTTMSTNPRLPSPAAISTTTTQFRSTATRPHIFNKAYSNNYYYYSSRLTHARFLSQSTPYVTLSSHWLIRRVQKALRAFGRKVYGYYRFADEMGLPTWVL